MDTCRCSVAARSASRDHVAHEPAACRPGPVRFWCPDISATSRFADTWLSLSPAPTHDGEVTSTLLCPWGHAATRRAAMSGVTDLERFWPSRRGHAFDEFCR